MKYLLLRLKRFCGFLTGLVFFVSGILKLLDPVGAGLVMQEYFGFLHISFLDFASKFLGTALALAETVIGTGLITGVWRRNIGICAMAFQGFFSLLTLLLVIFNPEMDCGCFGEAIHLTHMQTFLKNIALCILLAAYFFPQKMLGQNVKSKYVSFGIVTVSVIAFSIYSWIHIPMVDFTDFKPGAELQAGRTEEAEEGFESVFIYEKDGEQETFTLENLPDSTWTFVSTETRPIGNPDDTGSLNLSFYDEEGVYMDHLAAEGKMMAVSVYDTDISEVRWKRIEGFMKTASEAGFHTLLLVSSSDNVPSGIRHYICDYKTLLTMNRSNGGVTYFSDGRLISKWSYRAMPDMKELKEIGGWDVTETMMDEKTKGSLGFQGFLLYVFAVMLLL